MNLNSTIRYTLYDTTGSLFEEAVSVAIGSVSLKRWGKGAFVTTDIVKDQHQGTDFTVLGVPMDVTLNVVGKNRTKWSKTTIDLGFGKVNFGIRTGNGKVKFAVPVLILGFTFADIRKSNASYLVEAFKDQIQEILETGMDIYFEEEALA